MTDARYTPVADHALLISFASEISDAAHQKVIALDQALADDPPPGLLEAVPAMVNLLIDFDPLITDHTALQASVETQVQSLKPQALRRATRRVQVCYDAPFAPDLPAVARATGLSEDAVINAHLAGDYQVLMYGFAPGYAYLGGVPDPIQVPRKPVPLRDVPAGSVIIAGPQCLITTLTMPTGWSIIGRSPTRVLTDDPDHPFLFDIGDRVMFERISADQLAGGPHG
tara:strand:+ start:959 stop:1639 length:681 start_codon:yes stop_codon:yes gene_type:complete